MVDHLCEDTGIQLPRGINPSIHGIEVQGYTLVFIHEIQVMILKLEYYLLLCSIIRPYLDLETILNTVNGIEHPMLELEKRERKRRVFSLFQI